MQPVGVVAGGDEQLGGDFRAHAVHVEPTGAQLTRRELAVLRGLADGLSYTEVAHTLFITPNTVKTHVSSLYRKLGVERSAQALRAARQLGMLPPGE